MVNQLQILTSSLLLLPTRSPHNNTHYGSSINTFTVRPGTRHPISYAYSGAHWKAPS